MKILEIKNIHKSFNNTHVLNNISLDIFKGQIFGLLGPNGAGKSTLINIICGFLKPNHGTLELFNSDNIQKNYLLKKKIGVVAQDNCLYQDLTIKENLDFHLKLYSYKKYLRKKRIQEVSSLFDLTPLLNYSIYKLSGGQRRRVALAKAVIHSPELLILDEPTTGLDPAMRQEFWEKIKYLNQKEAITVFFTTHYLEEAENICDIVSIIDRGRILITDSPESLKKQVGKKLIEVELENPKDLKKIKEISFVHRIVNIKDLIYQIEIKNTQKNFIDFYNRMTKNKINMKNLSIKETTLMDVYFHYTKTEFL